VAPVAGVFALRRDLEEPTLRRAAGAGELGPLFRRRAIDHHSGAQASQGRPLEVSPAWTRHAFAVILAVVGTALGFASLASIDEHARGPAVVRASGRTEVTARLSGTVASIAAVPGRVVAAGDLLLRFDDADESAELARAERELELALAQRLRDPADRAVEARLQGLRAARDLAAARLGTLSVRAPHAGVVGEVWARSGRFVAAGEVLVSLVDGRQELTVLAMLPGHYRSRLEPGMTLRLELDGFRYAHQELEIERISTTAVGAAEARRILGAEIGDAVTISTPVVFVSARVPATGELHAGGRTHPYHAGLRGTAEVRVRSERLLPALLPGLRALTEGGGG
jgi:membrane fusion protein (multidrug efflux system)